MGPLPTQVEAVRKENDIDKQEREEMEHKKYLKQINGSTLYKDFSSTGGEQSDDSGHEKVIPNKESMEAINHTDIESQSSFSTNSSESSSITNSTQTTSLSLTQNSSKIHSVKTNHNSISTQFRSSDHIVERENLENLKSHQIQSVETQHNDINLGFLAERKGPKSEDLSNTVTKATQAQPKK